MDVNRILDHSSILKHLDLLGHTSNGKVVAVTVKLDATTPAGGPGRMEQGRTAVRQCQGRLFDKRPFSEVSYLETILEPL